MGVHGLWRLIEPAGKPVPLETLENKVLAVDVSIWLHQAIKGFQDSKGASVPNAHLLSLYHRICKLLYYKIKPVFVFDGGVPVLKRQTMVKRSQAKCRTLTEADKIHKQLLNTLLKHSAISKVLTEKIEASLESLPKDPASRSSKDEMFILPPPELDSTVSSSEDESSYSSESSPTKNWELHTIDVHSEHFKSLPVDVRHEILTSLKETRKQSSWGRLHELPKVSDDFSDYQMHKLLKRQAVQTALEDAEKEMGGKSLSMAELESILKDQGVISNQIPSKRIASDESTKYILVKDVAKAIEEAQKNESKPIETDKDSAPSVTKKSKADEEYDEDLKKAIALSLECEPSTSYAKTNMESKATRPSVDYSALETFAVSDFVSSSSESSDDEKGTSIKTTKVNKSSAQSYMMEYSGLTPSEINKILELNEGPSKKMNINKPVMSPVNEEPEAATEDSDKGIHLDGRNSSIEFMSSSESSDAEPENEQKSLQIIVDPKASFEEDDDLFADVFEEAKTVVINVGDKNGRSNVEVVISPDKQTAQTKLSQTAKKPKVKASLQANFPADSTKLNREDPEYMKKQLENEKFELLTVKESPQANIPVEPSKLNKEDLENMKQQLEKAKVELIAEKSTKERMAQNITDQMYQEAQELLELFGIPYIVAPMEAEAQCAFLDAIDLTDGTITDDSDIWLFGGKTVYKNFFDQNKYVLEFRAENIKHNFKLTRQQMILLALLVGSDYTQGLQGVGPVTALEILAAFPPPKGLPNEFSLTHFELISGLKEFKSWFRKGKAPGPGRALLKNKLKNVVFTDNFPSIQVVQAYLDPSVESSNEAFSWGKPNFAALIEFAREKFGWTRLKAEEMLGPVLKRLQDNHTQKSIRDYFKTHSKIPSGDAETKMSKRVRTAVSNMGKEPSDIVAKELEDELKKQPKRKRKDRKKNTDEAPEFAKVQNNQVKNDEAKEESRAVKVNLKKLQTGASGSKEQSKEQSIDELVSNKVDVIKRRRKLKEAKVVIDDAKMKKKPKLLEAIPTELKADEEVNLLSKIIETSNKKVEEINTTLQEQLENLAGTSSTGNQRSSQKVANRPRIPKKEVIPQREKDKTTLLKNKLKAIETFRKGRQGPGFVPKREKHIRTPRNEAELSESSDD